MPLPADAHIGQVSLIVRNLEQSVSFYRDVLGFVELGERKDAGASTALGPAGGRVLIELHERKDAIAKPRRSTGLFHFAILVPSRAALGRSLRHLAETRWPISGASDHLVSEALYLDDPDGDGHRSARPAGRARRAGRGVAVERA
jgi:catechol 2,3-dioxygenase